MESSLSQMGTVLSRVQPQFVKTVNQSPVFSPDQRKRLVDRFGQIVNETIDGVNRERGIVTVNEDHLPDKVLFSQDDITMKVRLEGLEDDVQYFVSLGLNTIERLYLTNRLSEDLYFKYRRLLRFLPQFHGELVRLYEESSRD